MTTFKDFLILYDIPFTEDKEDNTIQVDDKLIIPYEQEFRKHLPNGELFWDYQRYRNEPKGVSS